MQTKVRFKKAILAALPAIIGGLYANVAGAAGFQLLEQNASGMGTAYAGSAVVAEDASTVFFNPAGMAYLPKTRNVAFGVDAINPSAKFSGSGSAAPLLQTLSGNNGGDAGDLAFVPHAYFTMPLSDKATFGIGMGAPYGLKTEYDNGWDGRFQAIKSDVKIININPSFSYKVNDAVALGIGLNLQHLKGEFTSSVNYAGAVFAAAFARAVAAGVPPAAAQAAAAAAGRPAGEGLGIIKGSDTAWGFNFGVIFEPSPATRLGVSYRSEIDYHLTGNADFSRTGIAAIDGVIGSAASSARGGAIYADIKIPDTLIISGLHHVSDKWDIMGDLSWTGWSKIPALTFNYVNGPAALSTTQENWRDTWRAAVGASYKYNEQWKARAGLAYDQTPVPDSTRTPRLPDSDRTWLSLGGQYKLSKDSAIDFGYTHIFVKDGSINNNAGSQNSAGLLVGSYDNSVDILGLQYSLSF